LVHNSNATKAQLTKLQNANNESEKTHTVLGFLISLLKLKSQFIKSANSFFNKVALQLLKNFSRY